MQVIPIPFKKEIDSSDSLADIIISSAQIRDGDILVVAQKVISKQEGQIIQLDSIRPSLLAEGIAAQYRKDPRLVQVILSETKRIVRMQDGILIVQNHNGFVCANAGVDESNVKNGHVTLLPINSDESAQRIRLDIAQKTQKKIAVVISDTFGRPFRMGQANCAIGVSGMNPISDYTGMHDSFGRVLRVTSIAVADEIASAAELVMKKTDRCPTALIRGYSWDKSDESIAKLVRPQKDDLFI